MARKVRVVTSQDRPTATQQRRSVIISDNPPRPSNRLTENEIMARKFATTTTFSSYGGGSRTADTAMSATSQFYSPQLSTDFLEKPQNLRERRAFYRFFYNTNEIIGQAIDIHSTLPLSKLRLVPPRGKNKDQNKYVFKYFEDMCENMKLFKTLIEMTHEYYLFGNCATRWAGLRTPNGFKRADEIQVGDLVLTDKGRFRPITKRTVRPSETYLNIKCWKDFRGIPITEEHPIEVLRDEGFEFIEAGDLKLSDYVRATWSETVEDVEKISFDYPSNYTKVDNGYELDFEVPHPRNPKALQARKAFLGWLQSLSEPVIKTRDDISKDLDVSRPTLDNVIFKLGKEIETPFHKRLGATGWQKGSSVQWFPIEDVEVTDSYIIKKKRFLSATDQIDMNDDFAYLAGYWLGDGTLSRDSSKDSWGRGLWQLCFSSEAKSNIERCNGILCSIFGSDAIKKWDCEGITYLRVNSNPAFIEWWSENFGETTFGNNLKKVPEWFVNLPTEKLKNFLSGLLDSDGCVSVSGEKRLSVVSVSTASRQVMDIVRDICLKCGAIVSYNQTTPHDCTLPNGNIVTSSEMFSLVASDEESCRILADKASKSIPEDAVFSTMERYWARTEDGVAFKVKEISTQGYNDLVFNFEVEEDHTYQVNGFSTHNCFVFAEEWDYTEGMSEDEKHRKKEEASQRSTYLKEKFEIKDKDPLFKGWKKLVILPPDQVRVRKLPLSDDVAVEYVPDPETRKFITSEMHMYPDMTNEPMKYDIPAHIQEKVRMSGTIPLDTDPYTGSHVYHLARKKSQYEPLGVSIIERCINTLVYLDKLRQAQTSIASRHMTPMRIVWAEDLSVEQVDELREQVDMALVDPDYSIIANYEIHWEEMGSNGRLLDIEAEFESALNRLFAGLGVTREVLTGEGTYSGSKISLEVMNTQYLLYREVLQEYVENNLFKPIARKKGFVEYDDYGNEVLIYPRLSFTRLAIRDNEQFFDAAFQLYQKGSVSIDLILDILNIDPSSTQEKIEKDMFTVNDSQFNEVLRNIYTNVATNLVDQTDLTSRLARYMGLDEVAPPPAEGGDQEGMSRFSSLKKVKGFNPEQGKKLEKVMQFFAKNPQALEKVFT